VTTAEVQLCGAPEFHVNPRTGRAHLAVYLHTTDPDSKVHAQLNVYLDPRTGRFWFDRDWLL
jgi:hypothetical protein